MRPLRVLVVAASLAVTQGTLAPAGAQSAEPGRPVTAVASDARVAVAMKARDLTAVRSLLRQKANANGADVEGMTALHWAAHWNDVDAVKLLLASGASPRHANRYGVTPLHEAATV